MHNQTTCLIIPCFNEAKRLDSESFKGFAAKNENVHFLFVDDGSTDDTRELLNSLVQENPGSFSFITLINNLGKAEAVRTGVLEAFSRDFGYIGYWDADLATPLEEVHQFEAVLSSNPEIEFALGCRHKRLGTNIRRQASRHYLGRFFATAVSMVLRLAVYDTQCGAKLFRSNDEIKSAFQTPFRTKWIFDVEILARLQKSGMNFEKSGYEVPLTNWQDVFGSKVKLSDFLVAAIDLFKIYRATRHR